MTYIAHKREDGTIQSVREHSEKTAFLSGQFAVKELTDICFAMGLLHDIGKYQKSFQKRIQGAPIRVEHAICGAKASLEQYGKGPLGLLLSLCIAGHHSGIPDCGGLYDTAELPSLYGRLKRGSEDYGVYAQELTLPQLKEEDLCALLLRYCRTKDELLEGYAFLTRYCFSCLTDADTIDTMQAMGFAPPEPLRADFTRCREILEGRLHAFHCVTPLQKARASLQKQVFKNMNQDAEIYLMGMPTGSGKTLASMECALIRAALKKKKRIIYVIPYNSIIDQTVAVLEELFGDSVQILRHQSSFSYEDAEDLDEDYRQSAIYGCENWDAELIVTTAVQFFESVYGNRRGKLRKLHNMADSILIFDEAHLLPLSYLQPCLRAIAYITKFLHSEAIFLTATMPDFASLIREYALQSSEIVDLVTDHSEFTVFKKNKYTNLGTVSDDQLLKKAASFSSSLIVVNNRRAAQTLYQKCPGRKYHLSTYMTAFDRARVIGQIRKETAWLREDYPDLTNVPAERRITVISTSLVEAGVDLDFAAAFRELNGLDNVLQTGGRCNREGYLSEGEVFLFQREDFPTSQTTQMNILQGIISEFDDIASDEAIKAYYDRLLRAEREQITNHSLCTQCGSLDTIPFRSYSDQMHLIESDAISVAVVQDETSKRWIDAGKYIGYINTRGIQKYCFSVYPHELRQLMELHAVEEIGGIPVLTCSDYYDPQTGVRFESTDYYI